MAYINSLYQEVMTPFAQEGNGGGVDGMVERWRAMFQEIVAGCVGGTKHGQRLKRRLTAPGSLKRKLEGDDEEEEQEDHGKGKGKGKGKQKAVRWSKRLRSGSVGVDLDSD